MKFKYFLSLLLACSPVLASSVSAEKTLTWSASSDLLSCDPYTIYEVQTLSVLNNVFEGLLRRDEHLKLQPALATEWKNIEPTVWRFKLRQNVQFHDGTPFTADDVIFSLKRAQEESSNLRNRLSSIKEGKKIDDFTVELITFEPNVILDQELSTWYILSKTWCEKNNAVHAGNVAQKQETYANYNANGTGPFKLIKREPDIQSVFEVNKNWWDHKKHNLDKAIFKPIKSEATRVSALMAGDVDVILSVPLQDETRVNKNKKLKVVKGPQIRTLMFQMNQGDDELKNSDVKGKNPFKDIRVREAIYRAIDIDSIHKKVMRGNSFPTAWTFGREGIQGYDKSLDKRIPYSPSIAKKLLKEAGFEKGFGVTLDCPNDRDPGDANICSAVVGMLSKIGVRVTPNIQSKSIVYPKILARKSDFLLLGWTALNYDGSDTLKSVIASHQGDFGKFNLGSYSNPKIDVMIQGILKETDAKKRVESLHEASKAIQNDFAVIPLHQQKLIWGYSKNIKLVQRADEFFDLRFVHKD
jgi:peptide/nickel transport system substrate-binding protein